MSLPFVFSPSPPIDFNDCDWPDKCYRVIYKEPQYKGGRWKERVPGWCDRILMRHMMPEDRWFIIIFFFRVLYFFLFFFMCIFVFKPIAHMVYMQIYELITFITMSLAVLYEWNYICKSVLSIM